MTDADDLWGSVLTSFEVNLIARTVTLRAHVVDQAASRDLTLLMDGVRHLHVRREDAESWNYIEITEAHIRQSGGETHVELTLWTEPESIDILCESATVSCT